MKKSLKCIALAVLAAAGVLAGGVPAGGSVTAMAAAPADYSYLTSAYRARGTFLESRKDDNGRSMSEVIDRGDYYELTNVNFYVFRKYSTDEVEACVPGDIFRVNGRAYTVESAADGEYVLARTDSYGEITYEYLRRVEPGKNRQSYYIAEKRSNADRSFDSADLYSSGSAFFRKDALISAAPWKTACRDVPASEEAAPGNTVGQDWLAAEGTVQEPQVFEEGVPERMELPAAEDLASDTASQVDDMPDTTVMTAEQYFTSDADARGLCFDGGWFPNEGYAKLNGTFTLDTDGYITSFTEKL